MEYQDTPRNENTASQHAFTTPSEQSWFSKTYWTYSQVISYTTLSRVHIWRLEQEKRFPPRRNITENRVVWKSLHIKQWMETATWKDEPAGASNT